MTLMLVECNEDNSLLIIGEDELVKNNEKKVSVGDSLKFFHGQNVFIGIVRAISDNELELVKIQTKLIRQVKPKNTSPSLPSSVRGKRNVKHREQYSPEPPSKKNKQVELLKTKKDKKESSKPEKTKKSVDSSTDDTDVSDDSSIEEGSMSSTKVDVKNSKVKENSELQETPAVTVKIDPVNESDTIDDGLDTTQLLGKAYQCEGGMVHLAGGVYCKRRTLNIALARAKKGTNLVRNLLEGVFNEETLMKCTITGQTARKKGTKIVEERIAMNPGARESIIDFVESQVEKHPRWPKQSRKEIQNAIMTKLVEIKSEFKKNQELDK